MQSDNLVKYIMTIKPVHSMYTLNKTKKNNLKSSLSKIKIRTWLLKSNLPFQHLIGDTLIGFSQLTLLRFGKLHGLNWTLKEFVIK